MLQKSKLLPDAASIQQQFNLTTFNFMSSYLLFLGDNDHNIIAAKVGL